MIQFYKSVLYLAVENENIEIINLLLSNSDININSTSVSNGKEDTALNIAIRKNNIEIVKLLLANLEIDVYPQPKKGNKIENPLIIASRNKNYEIIELLLKYPKIDKNEDFAKENILINAINDNDIDIVKLLLSDPNINVNYKSVTENSKDSLLNIAIRKNNNEIIKLFMNHPKIEINSISIISKKVETPLNIAIENKNNEIINLLISNQNYNIDFVADRKHYFLDEEINLGYIYRNIEFYLHEGETALCAAVRNKDINTVKLILTNNGKKFNNDNQLSVYCVRNTIQTKTPLSIAIENDDLEMTKYLLSFPKKNFNMTLEVNETNGIYDYYHVEQNVLHIAVQKGNLAILKLLLSHTSIDINSKMFYFRGNTHQKSSAERTALHIAIDNKNIDIIKFLITIPHLNINERAIYGNEKIIGIDFEEDICYSGFWETDGYKRIETSLFTANSEIRKILLSSSNLDKTAKSDFFSEKRYYLKKDRVGLRYSYSHKSIKNEELNIS